MTYAILTCSEHFTDLALNELRRQHPDISLIEQPAPQYVFLKAPGTFDTLTRPWRTDLPVYLHHLFPVHRTLSLTGTPVDFDSVREASRALSHEHSLVQIQVAGDYAYPPAALEQAMYPGQPLSDMMHPDGRVISLLVAGSRGYMGISWTSQNLSAFPSGRPYFDEPVPNRAGLKLLEALAAFQITLRPGDHALDLGAAPGAWTGVLRRRGMNVTAVAPDRMYPWVETDSGVRVLQTTAQEYLQQCDTTYALLVNDMKLDARDSARLMVDYAAHLRPEGIAIMTLKLRLQNPRGIMDHAYRILRQAYKIIRVRNLVSNRKEMTLFLRRKE